MSRISLLLAGMAVLFVTACASREPDLLTHRRSGEGPDEFTVAPSRPLETPPDRAALPAPTLGQGINRADATPKADAIVAMGGRASSTELDGIPAGDAALIRHTHRNGRDPNIRTTLADEDLEFRRRNDGLILERMANANVYFESYSRHSLQQQEELDRLRASGVRTPGAPPEDLFPE